MAPNSPACSFIHTSMAGSRSAAPLKRSNSVLIVGRLSAFGINDSLLKYMIRAPRETAASPVQRALHSVKDPIGTDAKSVHFRTDIPWLALRLCRGVGV